MTGKRFYVYLHRRATDGTVFYVGKGNGDRYKSTYGRNAHWKSVVKKHGFISEVLIRFDREECAFSFEKALISHYGRSNLTNKTDGGDGVSGYKATPCLRILLGSKHLGRKKTPEHIEAVRLRHTGAKRSAATCDRISSKSKERLSNPRNHPRASSEKFTWCNVQSGDVFTGSHIDLAEYQGISIDPLRKVRNGELFSYKGWKAVGVRTDNKREGVGSSTACQKVYVWSKRGCATFIGARSDFAHAISVKPVRLYPIVSGKTKTFKGWSCREL